MNVLKIKFILKLGECVLVLSCENPIHNGWTINVTRLLETLPKMTNEPNILRRVFTVLKDLFVIFHTNL